MELQSISNLTLNDRVPANAPPDASVDRYLLKLKTYAESLPYSIESNSRMQELLDFILLRICQCVEAKDFDPGLLQWDSMIA
jgi:proteasome activator subunit 4